jgi:hypothetical protein
MKKMKYCEYSLYFAVAVILCDTKSVDFAFVSEAFKEKLLTLNSFCFDLLNNHLFMN